MTKIARSDGEISVDQAVSHFPIDKLVYAVFAPTESEIRNFVDLWSSEQREFVGFAGLTHGSRVKGVSSPEVVPMVLSFINSWPVSGAPLDSADEAFFEESEAMGEFLTRDV